MFKKDDDSSSDEEKKKKQKEKDIKFIKKIGKMILIVWIITIIFFVAGAKKLTDEADIYKKVGASDNGYSVTIKDALILEDAAINTFRDYLVKEEYLKAYNMMSKEYKEYYNTLDMFKEAMAGINFSSIKMTEVKKKSDYAYVAGVTYAKNGHQVYTQYMIYPNQYRNDVYTLSPDKFLKAYKNKSYKGDGIEIQIDEVIAYTDRVSIKGSIKDTEWAKDIVISEVAASYNESLNSWVPFSSTLKPGETAQIDIETDKTNYFVPDKVLVRRQKDDTSRIYVVNLEEKS